MLFARLSNLFTSIESYVAPTWISNHKQPALLTKEAPLPLGITQPVVLSIWSGGARNAFRTTNIGHRRKRVSGIPSVRTIAGGRRAGIVRRQFFYRPEAQRRAPSRPPEVRADAARRYVSALCRGR